MSSRLSSTRRKAARNQGEDENIKVAVRVRPFNQRERLGNPKCAILMKENTVSVSLADGSQKSFAFDKCYWSHDGFKSNEVGTHISTSKNYATQEDIYKDLGKAVVDNTISGYNNCVFAYGQTSAGKSYTMIGTSADPGLIGRIGKDVFDLSPSKDVEVQVTLSMFEIYNEKVRDLLASTSSVSDCRVRQHPKQGFFVQGLSKVPVSSFEQVSKRMHAGTLVRTTASTNMNQTSSRSHMVVSISVKQVFQNAVGESTTKMSDIHLVDLAGSERVATADTHGDRLKEGSAINLSLSTLGNVIAALADNSNGSHAQVPYRDSVLTKILSNALGGNSKTVMIAALSPAPVNAEESLSTLRFADRAKRIKCQAIVNESPTDKLIRELKEENKRLLEQLQSTGGADREGLQAGNIELSREVRDLETAWQARLDAERQRWELQQSDDTLNLDDTPYLTNVNPDPQLTRVVDYIITVGRTVIGRLREPQNEHEQRLVLTGPVIADNHCVLVRDATQVCIEPCGTAVVNVNGARLEATRVLKHLDRVVFSSSHSFLYIGLPHERKPSDDLDAYDYDFMQLELVSEQGMGDLLGGRTPSTISLTPENQQLRSALLTVMPLISQANAISVALAKQMQFELFVRSGAAHSLTDKSKTVMIQALNVKTRRMWQWTADDFVDRFYSMQDMYNAAQMNDTEALAELAKDDPFDAEPSPVFLGSAHIFLQPLAFGIEVEEEVPVSNYRGKTVAKLAVQVALCSPEGVISQGYQAVEGPTDLKDQRLDIVVKILYASDVEWINQEHSRGVQCKFRFYTDSKFRETKTVFSKSQPNFKYTKQFTIGATQAFLNYLQTNALIVELWGAQGNGSSVKPSRVRFGSQNRATPSAQPLVDSSFNASACANANANMESILKESEWAEERRHLQDQVHQLEQEIDFLHIEKGVLVREATRASTKTFLPSLTVENDTAPDDVTSATSAFLQAQRLLSVKMAQAESNQDTLSPQGAKTIKALSDALKAAADRLTNIVNDTVKENAKKVKSICKK